MAISKQKRAKMEKLVSDVMSALDTTGTNTKKYKDMFSTMSDAQFDTYFKKLFSSDDNNLVLDIVDYERDLKIENLEKASKILGVPLFEKVAMPFVNKDKNNPVITKYEVPVGYIHVKRVQQILSKKNTTSTEIASRSSMTGQVMGKDKNARDSDMENFSLVTLDAHETLREFMGPRADDMVMKNEMYSQISQKGYVSLDSLTNNVNNKVTLNTIDVYLIGMGIKSDLITKGLHLPKSLE